MYIKKLMGREEKKECEDSVDGVGREVAWRDIKDRNRAAEDEMSVSN